MNKSGKIICILSVVLGLGFLGAHAANAVYGYGNGNAAPVAVKQSCHGQCVKKDKDGSLFPGGSCKSCTKDGSLFPGGECKSCTKDGSLFPGTCQRCEERLTERSKIKNYVPFTPVVYEAVQRNCCDMAPLSLAHVDFRIKKGSKEDPYSSKLGNYRFRIFGCRRFDKEAILNKGRVMEKNIAFNTTFEEVVGDCYKVLPMPKDLCLEETTTELPEYVLTAEITDYFMNICDEYDWDRAEKNNARNGSSEITVIWRLMDLTKSKVYWKGESTGYGELLEGETNGEVKLVERAFADAAGNLRNLAGFEEQLSQRLTPEEIEAQRLAIVEEERKLNPAKCGYKEEYRCAKRCEISRPGADVAQCKPCQPCTCPQVAETTPVIMEDGGVIEDVIMPVEEVIITSGNVIGGGCPGAAQNVMEEVGELVEDGGVTAAGSVMDNSILESGDVVASGGADEILIIEDGAVISSFDIINSCIDESGNVKSDGVCQVVDDTWIDTGDVKALDNFCVNATDPCKQLSPETIYRLRSSIVQIAGANGRKGAGLLISDRFILTSGDLIDKNNNSYEVKTVHDDELSARAVRFNPSKNTALLMLSESTQYTPLALNLSLPEVGRSGFLTVGLLDVNDFKDGEDYLENSARIEGYRYTDDKGAEILVNTFIQNVTVGGALIYKDCTINGMAHSGIKTDDSLDLFIPTETALRSLGISICGHEYVEESPWQQTVYKPVTEQIKKVQKAPEAMNVKDRK